MDKTYQAKDIQILEGLEAVRLRPGMYIGTTGSQGLHHILWEIVDNAVDEAANGHATLIDITINTDNSVVVYDNGRGIPVDIHPQYNKSGVEIVFTKLHAGGKFNSENYEYSGGLHGVGASVTNALSKWLNVEVYKENKRYSIKFGVKNESDKTKYGVALTELICQDNDTDVIKGTKIHFMPDSEVFGNALYSYEIISRRVKELAFLNKGIIFTLTDKRFTDENGEYKNHKYCFDGGIIDFVKHLCETKKSTFTQPLYFSASNQVLDMECAFTYTDSYTESVFSYVNNISTHEGGMHETGFKAAFTKVFNDHARKIGQLKDKDENLIGEDYREGITCVISIKMRNPQFEGQTKAKLGNVEARSACEAISSEELSKIIEQDNKNISLEIIKKAIASAKVREAARKAKEITRAKNSIENASLVGKLSACSGRNAKQNELFIVEGDSAGGSAKMGRDRKFQAILPLRGKPLNVERKRMDQVLLNEEIRSIITALDTSIGQDFDLSNLKYHKVIILADADQDGAHIRAILLTFFYRYMKELISEGHVYIGMPPLYKIVYKGETQYAYDDNELNKLIENIGRGYTLSRYKGLGEMNPEQLAETTLNPSTRTLMRVTLDEAAEAETLIATLMGDNIEARKAYIYENINFNRTSNNIEDLLD